MRKVWVNTYVDEQWKYAVLHRIPCWMTVHMHLVIEEIIERHVGWVMHNNRSLLYHFIYGVICGYTMREIVWFIKRWNTTDRGIAP